jgi:hypothetical protein
MKIFNAIKELIKDLIPFCKSIYKKFFKKEKLTFKEILKDAIPFGRTLVKIIKKFINNLKK